MHNLLIYFEELKSVVILLAPTLDSPSGGGEVFVLFFCEVRRLNVDLEFVRRAYRVAIFVLRTLFHAF